MIKDVEYFSPVQFEDNRGKFTKLYSRHWTNKIQWKVGEVFYTSSKIGTVRGMHLQIERSENWRLISVIEGTIFDVLIDLRPNSETYNEVICLDLDFANRSTVLVPPGVAHGFQALSNCITMYVSSEPYDRSLDKGINIRSLSIKWPLDITHISDRDRCLPMNKNW